MLANPLLAALDDALECPHVAHLSRADRLTLSLWRLIKGVADEFEMPPERAADEVAMLCGLAKEMMGEPPRTNYRALRILRTNNPPKK